ncbi:MAG: beta-ketoacyl-[acyl-carrier-protein] synthase family protein [Burkholderiales bacterium]
MSEPVCITGVGVVSGFGDSCDRFRDSLHAGATAVHPSAQFEAAGCRSVLAARVSQFDPARWISPMKLRRMDDTGPFALVAIQQAMAQARYVVTAEGDDRTGVVLGTYSAGGQATNDYLAALFRGGPTGAPALLFNSTVANAAAGLAGLEFKLRGPNATISQKEASGLAAIATAVDLLQAGRADAVATGGMDALYEIFFRTHDRFGVMSTATAFGTQVAPFSRCRRGFVMGEGGFGLWIERGGAWRERGARCLAEIVGVGASSATVPINAWPDHPEPLVRTMRQALDEAGVRPSEVDVVYASANASRVLDDTEARALIELFGASPVVTSVKSALGEFGASGSASCVAAVLCGAAGHVPPIAGLVDVDPVAAPLRIATSRAATAGPIVLVNSFASGGALFSVVLRVHRHVSRAP